ncbi:MAG TPA: hypothetical protein VHH36_01540 [Candidatus Thermoplasmatota archaeon]|nr:hypothetical protein [Candidatus Thermoplasmatota archaeon]
MRLVLDTSAFYYARALRRVPRGDRVIVPAVAFAERARQLKRDGRASPAAFHGSLADRGWKVEAFREEHALRAAHLAPVDDARWQDLARDVLVAAHVRPDDVLLTANVGDFLALGLPAARLRDPSRVV